MFSLVSKGFPRECMGKFKVPTPNPSQSTSMT